MEKNNNILEEALNDINLIQEALKKNTKEILHATMREEIENILKESIIDDEKEIEKLNCDECETNENGNENGKIKVSEESSENDTEIIKLKNENINTNNEKDDDDLFEEIDLTNASDEEVIKVFKRLKDDDEIEIVSKNHIIVRDTNNDEEYSILVDLSKLEELKDELQNELNDDDIENDKEETEEDGENENDEDIEIDIDNDDDDENVDEDKNLEMKEESEENIYEIELEDSEDSDESIKIKELGKKDGMDFYKFDLSDLKENYDEEIMLHGQDRVAEEEELEFDDDETEISENKSRAMADLHAQRIRPEGSKEYHTAPIGRSDKYVSLESYKKVLNVAKQLHEENLQIKSALKEFKKMLAETVLYNTNLTYLVKIITEHATTKDEKIQIMKRFDNVKTIQESKNLYKTILTELNNKNVIKENVSKKIENNIHSGSSQNLLNESTIYVDNSTKRIIELMKKIDNKE